MAVHLIEAQFAQDMMNSPSPEQPSSEESLNR
jgi:hypothetical protein